MRVEYAECFSSLPAANWAERARVDELTRATRMENVAVDVSPLQMFAARTGARGAER